MVTITEPTLTALWSLQHNTMEQQALFIQYLLTQIGTIGTESHLADMQAELGILDAIDKTSDNYQFRRQAIQQTDDAIRSVLLAVTNTHQKTQAIALSDSFEALVNIEQNTGQVQNLLTGIRDNIGTQVTSLSGVQSLLAEIRDNISDLKFNGQQVTYVAKDAKITIDFLGITSSST